jgi:hypothetical protein
LVAARRELAKQRGEFPLDLDHFGLAGELVAQPGVVAPQPGVLACHRVDRWTAAALGLAERGQRTLVALFAPLGDQPGLQPLAPQQRALASLVELLLLGQDAQLVGGRVGAWRAGPLGHLGVRWRVTGAVCARACTAVIVAMAAVVPLSPSTHLFQ